MKKLSILISLLGLFAIARADDLVVAPEKLPEAAQTFLRQNFPKQKIVRVTQDKDWLSSTYEVRLENGAEIEFASNGEWTEIDMKRRNTLPEALIPAKILSHLKANFAGSPPKQIEKKRYGYKVELRDDTELRFKRDGTFIGFDD